MKSIFDPRPVDTPGARTQEPGIARTSSKPRFGDRCCHGTKRATSRASALISHAAGRIELCGEPAGPRDIGKADALTDAHGEHRRLVLGERLGGLAGDHNAGRPAVSTKRATDYGRKVCASSMRLSISPDAQPSNDDSCAGMSTRSASAGEFR